MRQFGLLSETVAGETLAQAAFAGAGIVQQEAIRRAPRDQGTLAANIVVRKSGKAGRKSAAYSVGPNRSAAHGIPLELGHNIVRGGKIVGHAAARPYLRPAIDATREQVTGVVRAKLDEGIRKVTGG